MWWVWVVSGIALAIAEVALPGYVFLGFAIGAVATGVLIGLGLLSGGLPWLLLVCGVISAAAWLAVRTIFRVQGADAKIWKRDIND